MVTKKSLTLTALVAAVAFQFFATDCASQTPNLNTTVVGYDLKTFQPAKFVQDNKYIRPEPIPNNYPAQPLLQIRYKF